MSHITDSRDRAASTDPVSPETTSGAAVSAAPEADTREYHTYFGPHANPLLGTVHLPADGVARGTVLICPPLSKEHFDSVRGLRLLAVRLAARGLAVLRLDYFGTGDSALTSSRDDIVELWQSSVRAGVQYLRDFELGAPAVVALRAGAPIVTAALAELVDPVGPVVLWDPIGKGRSFVREQRALFTLTTGGSDSDSGMVPLLGITLSTAGVEALSALQLDPAVADRAARWLVATRPDSTDKTVQKFAAAVGADSLAVADMEPFVQAAGYLVRIPDAAITDIAAWLDNAVEPRTPRAVQPELRTEARVTVGEITITERIESIGPHGLFAIRAQALDAAPDAPAVLFFATALDTHHGPGRSWVELSRMVAAVGGQAVRFDRRGAGESGSPLDPPAPLYSADPTADALDAARATAAPQRLLTTGVCSGSWFSAYVGRELRANAVVIINAVHWSWRHKHSVSADEDLPETMGIQRSDPAFINSPRGRLKHALRNNLPYRGWRLLGQRGITQVPEVLLRPLVDNDTAVTVVLSPHDEDWFEGQRGPEGLARLQDRVTVVRTKTGDHTAYHPSIGNAVAAAILEWCATTSHPGS